MRKFLLPALLAGLLSAHAFAFEPFVVRDIRVEGIQRTEAGTVFSYLPVRVGESLFQERNDRRHAALEMAGLRAREFGDQRRVWAYPCALDGQDRRLFGKIHSPS